MTIPARSRSPRYNKLKKHALEIFDRQGGWLSPPQWAILAGFYPIRAAYSYLLRLHRFGLLRRTTETTKRVQYCLSIGGRKRLTWLTERARTVENESIA